MAGVQLIKVTKNFGSVVAVDDFSLDIADKEFMVLLGPSGCGKSTVLRMIAGLEAPTSGEVFIGDHLMNGVAPKDRDVAMVFQSYALYPHKTVRANIEFPLKTRGVDSKLRAAAVADAAAVLGLADLLDRKPGQLSGGQRQRVALARALVRDPQVFAWMSHSQTLMQNCVEKHDQNLLHCTSDLVQHLFMSLMIRSKR